MTIETPEVAATDSENITSETRRRFISRAGSVPLGLVVLPLTACGDSLAQPASTDNPAAAFQPGTEEASTGGFVLDAAVVSPNQDSRARTLVLHYTAVSLARTIALFTDPAYQASAHYVVPDAPEDGQRYRVRAMVPEARRAWHAGTSYWQGERLINAGSIGIEIVNPGYPPEDDGKPWMERHWFPYPEAQMAVVAALASDIVKRHQILPQKVVGHSDVAPGRKTDPGPLFPWQWLHQRYGLGAWPDAEAVSHYRTTQPFDGNIASLQARLLTYGYDTPQTGTLDTQTIAVVSAFQMHFRPSRYDGAPDIETVAILDALLEKYFGLGRQQTQAYRMMQRSVPGEKGPDVWTPGIAP